MQAKASPNTPKYGAAYINNMKAIRLGEHSNAHSGRKDKKNGGDKKDRQAGTTTTRWC